MSADKKNKFKSIALKLCAGGLTLVVAGLGYFYCTPKIYRATAKVKIVKSGWNKTNETKASFGPEKLPAECQIIRSNGILDQAIQNLNLNELWGKQYHQGTPLTTEESRARLRDMLDVHPVRNAIMVEIQVAGSDPNEEAKVVNEIARLYQNFRQTGRENASHEGISSLRAKWEAQNQKVQEAQAALYKLRAEINQDRSTNQVYDPEAMQDLQAKRISLEDEYVKKKDQLNKLKELPRDELKEVLPTVNNDPNSLLTGTLSQLVTAKNQWRAAQIAQGPDAAETKNAALIIEQLNKRVDELVDSTMSARAAELSSMKAALDRMAERTEQSKHATTNTDRFAAQDAAFGSNLATLNTLTAERETLENEMRQNGSMTAVMPGVITTEIVELADPPTQPASPDGKIALGIDVAGGVIAGAGLFLLLLLSMKPRGAEKKAA